MDVTLQADARSKVGGSSSRRLRAQGFLPGVVYGAGIDGAVAVTIGRRDLVAALSTEAGYNALITLEVDGQSHLTLAREIQRHPVRNEVIHVDFVAIRRDQEVTAEVPVALVGEAPATREGLAVTAALATVHISCLPGDMPTQVEVDVSGLAAPGDVIRAGDLELPRGVTLLTEADDPVVSVSEMLEVEEPEVEEPEEGEAAEGDEAGGGEPTEGQPGSAE